MKVWFCTLGYLIGILLCVSYVVKGQPACRDRDLNEITFDVNIDVKLETQDTTFYLFADVTWTVINPKNATIDGFAVHFLDTDTKRNHTSASPSIVPINACTSEDHLWVISSDQSACDSSSTAPSCSQNTGVLDSCLCPQPNCTLFYPPGCRSVLELLGPLYNYHLTVLPTTSHLRYPIQFDLEYEFSITPYYRKFANLSPRAVILQPVNECDDDVTRSFTGSACINIAWSPANVEKFVVQVNLTGDGNSTTVQTVETTENQAVICGLEVCKEYATTIYGEVEGTLHLLGQPTVYRIDLNITLGTSPNSTTTPAFTTSEPTTTPTVNVTTVTTMPPVTHDGCPMIPCDPNASCVDQEDGIGTCVCDAGYTGNGWSCEELSICDAIETECHPNATCYPASEFYECECNTGFHGDGIECEDLDECESSGACQEYAECKNTFGSFFCECTYGFEDNSTTCKNGSIFEDECARPDRHDCPDNSTCVNTFESYTCVCHVGFQNEGLECVDLNECAYDLHDCDENARCINTAGSYLCECKDGFQRNETNLETESPQPCEDINECDNTDNCHKDAICQNFEGNYTCTCPSETHVGDGRTCQIRALDCQETRIISGFTFPPTQSGLVSYSEEKCGELSCPQLPEDTVGICVEECNQLAPDCESGYLCCSNGCGHVCTRGVGGSEEGDSSGVSIASIRCVFTPTTDTSNFDITTLITTNCRETIKGITSPPYENVSRKLDILQVMTSEVEELTDTEVLQVTEFFAGISKESDQQFSNDDIKNVAEITSHLSRYYGQDSNGETSLSSDKQSLVQSVDIISRKLNGTRNNFNAPSQDINIAVQDVSSIDSGVTFSARFYSQSSPISPIQISIPTEALNKAQSQVPSSSVRIVSVGYRNSFLFPSEKTTGWVIASSLGDTNTSIERTSLTEPVVITNNQIEDQPGEQVINDFKNKLTKVECVFWDFNQESWSSDGCSLVPGTPVKCQCNHLTNFAILVSTKEIPSSFALSVVTYVGCGLSIICLICTVLFICLTKRLRKKHPMQIMANLCMCLAISFAFFLFGVESVVDKTGCAVLTAFLHYFLLVTWLWMAIYSHTVYRDVVKVLDSYGRSYNMLASCAIAYGIPLLIVVLNAGIALGHIDKMQPDDPFLESSYLARNYCWIRGYSLYFGFLLPVGILLVYNLVVFCIVIPKITWKRKQVQSSASPKGVKQNLIISLVMATTMGLSWVIGYLMLIADNVTYLTATSWIFAILNSFQGVFIFVFTVVRTGEIQRLLNKKAMNFSSTAEDKPTSTNSTGLSSRSPPNSPSDRL